MGIGSSTRPNASILWQALSRRKGYESCQVPGKSSQPCIAGDWL